MTKKVKHKTIKSLGYLDDLKQMYSDPVAHFKAVVMEMNQVRALENQPVKFSIDPHEALISSAANRKNI